MDFTFKGKLVIKKSNVYTEYVFQNVETDEYILCTKLPNWDCQEIFPEEEGYVTIEQANAGDSYIDLNGTQKTYKYTKLYFKNFIKINNSQNIKIL